jgi:predicted RNase H-like nuclease
MAETGRLVAGLDGCRSGWAGVVLDADNPTAPQMRHYERFGDVLDDAPALAVIAVDMPIGLPEQVSKGGRGAEQAARPLLGPRQSSVFSVPGRAAVMASDYAQACAISLTTSDPPRKVSKQCFNLFPKIREIDALMTPALEARVYEVHPEVAFWRLNGERAMALPKKIKGRANEPGLAERRVLLEAHGFEEAFFEQKRATGVGADDLIDASVNALIAIRILNGQARSLPTEPARDDRGLRVAIWA